MEDTASLLPDAPNEWGALTPDGFRQRWSPGAFGELPTIEGVVSFRVLEDDWREDDDGAIWRTIKRAEILERS